MNRIQEISKQKLSQKERSELGNYNSKHKNKRSNTIKLAEKLTGKLKYEILEELEEMINT